MNLNGTISSHLLGTQKSGDANDYSRFDDISDSDEEDQSATDKDAKTPTQR